MSHRLSRLLIIFWVLSFLIISPSFADDQPNIIVIVADDLGWADVGFHGNEQIATPALDRLAAEGVQLDRFYTHAYLLPHPRCTHDWP